MRWSLLLYQVLLLPVTQSAAWPNSLPVTQSTLDKLLLVDEANREQHQRKQWVASLFPLLSDAGSTREWETINSGIEAHPNLRRVPLSQNHSADFVIWVLGASGQFPPSRRNCPASKLVIVDLGDIHYMLPKTHFDLDATKPYDQGYHLYFKRSWVQRTWGSHDGVLTSVSATQANGTHQRGVFPFSYGVIDRLVAAAATTGPSARVHPIVCTLRGCPICVTKSEAERRWAWQAPVDIRLQVLGWVKEAVAARTELRGGSGSIVGEVNKGGRGDARGDYVNNMVYFNMMRAAGVVVTANPASWEGDTRLWEALMSGALVMCDQMYTPLHRPLIHGTHLVYYTATNKTDFITKLEYYTIDPRGQDEARRIGVQGREYAMRWHRSVSRIDYILSVVENYHDKPADSPAGTLPKDTRLKRMRFGGTTTGAHGEWAPKLQ
jgi:hypothetical protein